MRKEQVEIGETRRIRAARAGIPSIMDKPALVYWASIAGRRGTIRTPRYATGRSGAQANGRIGAGLPKSGMPWREPYI